MKLNTKVRFLRSLQPLLAATTMLFAGISADAAVFAKYDGIEGNAADKEHKEWINILSFDWGAAPAENADPSGPTALQPSQFQLELVADRAMPALLEAAATGKVFENVELHIIDEGDETRKGTEFIVKLTGVSITSFRTGGAAGEAPTGRLSLNYETIQWIHVERDPGQGSGGEFTWAVEEGRS